MVQCDVHAVCPVLSRCVLTLPPLNCEPQPYTDCIFTACRGSISKVTLVMQV